MEKLSKILSKFSINCVFRPNAQKLTHGLLNVLQNIVKQSVFNSFVKKFFQNFGKFQINCDFRPNAQKLNARFVKFFEKYAKIVHFRNFLKKFLYFF